MSYEIVLSEVFKKEAKRLIKKYPSLASELEELGHVLTENPRQGTPLGKDVFKIRLSIESKGKGKSGGARIISFVKVIQTTVFLLTIYNKGDKDGISEDEIKGLINEFL